MEWNIAIKKVRTLNKKILIWIMSNNYSSIELLNIRVMVKIVREKLPDKNKRERMLDLNSLIPFQHQRIADAYPI